MIRVGIVGCGRILNAHLRGFRLLRDKGIDSFRITALVARREEDAWMFHTRGKGPAPRPAVLPPETGDPLAAEHTWVSDIQDDVEPRVYTDYRRMIDDGVSDAVLDASTLSIHHDVGLAALGAGQHLLTQKPLAVTVRAARAMVERAREQSLALGTFENVRYRPDTRAARWAFDTGLLGVPQMALDGSIGCVWSPDRIVAETPWRHRKLVAGGGGSIDIGVHRMHRIRHVMGEIQSVQAVVRTLETERVHTLGSGKIIDRVTPEVDDTYFATAILENGAVAQLFWSWAGRGAPLAIAGEPAFFGSRGCIQSNDLILDGADREPLGERFERDLDAADRERFFPLGLRDEYALLQRDWLAGIEAGGTDPETSGEEGLRDLAAAYAMIESSALGRTVTLAEVLDGSVDGYQREIDEHYDLV